MWSPLLAGCMSPPPAVEAEIVQAATSPGASQIVPSAHRRDEGHPLAARSPRLKGNLGCPWLPLAAQRGDQVEVPSEEILAPATSPRQDASKKTDESKDDHFHATFQLLGKLGRGTFAQVYAAERPQDGKAGPWDRLWPEHVKAAVKVSILTGEGTMWERGSPENRPVPLREVKREVDVLRRVSRCDHCLDFYAFFVEKGMAYVLTERCSMSLYALLRSLSQLMSRDLRTIFVQAIRGVASIHAVGVVHRDIKPDNFLIQLGPNKDSKLLLSNYTVKLCDFGFSEVMTVTGGKPTLKGSFGTAPFMSPEMLKHTGYGLPTDVWSFGVMMFVLLFGRFPYQPLKSEPEAMKDAIRTNDGPIAFQVCHLEAVVTVPTATVSAVPLLGLMLQRNSSTRCTAEKALRHQWFHTEGAKGAEFNYFPVFLAARCCGAFDLRNILSKHRGKDVCKIDEAMIAEQSMHYPLCGARISKQWCEPTTLLTKESIRSTHESISKVVYV